MECFFNLREEGRGNGDGRMESGDIAAVEWMRLGEQLSEYGIKRRQHSAVVLKQVCEVYLHC